MGGTIQSYLALYGKKYLTPNLISHCATLISNHRNQSFSLSGNESFTFLWRYVGTHILAQLIGFSNSEGFSSTSGLLRVMPQHFIQIVGLPLGHFKTLLFFVFFKPFRSWVFDVVLTVAVLQDQNWLQFEVKKWWPKILPQILSGKEYNSWSHESQRVIPFLE